MWRNAAQILRSLRKDSGFALVTVLTLALAIGANTTIFSLGNGLLLKSQPGIGHPEDLVDLGRSDGRSSFDTLSYPNYLVYSSQGDVFAGVAAVNVEPTPLSLRAEGLTRSVYGTLASGNFFEVLQLTPLKGRFFSAEDDKPGAPATVVISEELWDLQFGHNASILGREVVLNGRGFTILGVAPKDFHGHSALKTDLWIPIHQQPLITPGTHTLESRSANWLMATARLKPGASMEQAQAAMTVVAARLAKAYPATNENAGLKVAPHRGFSGELGTAVTAFIGLLMIIVVIILAIACANVAGISLARSTSRQREVAVRIALGADRRRVIARMMTETLVLFAISGAVGILLSSWMTSFLKAFQSSIPVPLTLDLAVDYRVVTFTLLVTLGCAVVSGLGPALSSSRVDVVTALKEESGGTAYRRLRLRNAMVVAQVAMSLLLLIASGLFLRALTHAKSLDPGFDPNGVEVVSLNLFLAGYSEQTGRAFDRELIERVSALPGVQSVGLAVDLPMDGSNFGFGGIRIPERQPPPPYKYFSADWNLVTPGYLKTLKIPLLRGRDFREQDTDNAPKVAIINEAMAAELWPGEEALGKHLYNGPVESTEPMEVIGIVKNISDRSLGEAPVSFIYAPFSQLWEFRQNLVIRNANEGSVATEVRRLLQEMSPNLPVIGIQSMDQVTAFGLLPQRLAAWVSGSMGVVGLFLASLGIYGVTAYNVGRRTREIGIRVALGARPASVLHLVLGEGFRLTLIGLTLGCLAGAGVTWLIKGLLFGIAPTDALTFLGTSAVLMLVTMAASFIPARKAARVDPMVALRHN